MITLMGYKITILQILIVNLRNLAQMLNKSIIFTILILFFMSAEAGYNTRIALELGYMCKITDQSFENINNWNCSDCSKFKMQSTSAFQNTTGNIKGFTGYSPSSNSIIVSFRGSRDIKNWILNIDTVRTSYPFCSGCSVHLGFNTGYKMVASKIHTKVQQILSKYPNAKITVTGHSLGGALATLAAADLHLTYGIVEKVYTFGEPRVGNQNFAKNFEQWVPENYRVIDYADTVVHAPPSAFGFKHSNFQVWYQRGMQSYQICQAQSKQCANSIGTLRFSTSDHSLEQYLKLKQQPSFLIKIYQFINGISAKKIKKNDKILQPTQEYYQSEKEAILKIQKQVIQQ